MGLSAARWKVMSNSKQKRHPRPSLVRGGSAGSGRVAWQAPASAGRESARRDRTIHAASADIATDLELWMTGSGKRCRRARRRGFASGRVAPARRCMRGSRQRPPPLTALIASQEVTDTPGFLRIDRAAKRRGLKASCALSRASSSACLCAGVSRGQRETRNDASEAVDDDGEPGQHTRAFQLALATDRPLPRGVTRRGPPQLPPSIDAGQPPRLPPPQLPPPSPQRPLPRPPPPPLPPLLLRPPARAPRRQRRGRRRG